MQIVLFLPVTGHRGGVTQCFTASTREDISWKGEVKRADSTALATLLSSSSMHATPSSVEVLHLFSHSFFLSVLFLCGSTSSAWEEHRCATVVILSFAVQKWSKWPPLTMMSQLYKRDRWVGARGQFKTSPTAVGRTWKWNAEVNAKPCSFCFLGALTFF